MSLVPILLIGLVAGGLAKLLMRWSSLGNLLVLGIGGSLIAAGLWYAENQPASLLPPMVGAVILLVIYSVSADRRAVKDVSREEDFRKAA